jgi:hypothetical protein
MSKLTFGKRHIVTGLDPVADSLAGTVYSDVVNMEEYDAIRFILHKGVGATGTSTLTIEACDNAAGDNPVAIPFNYQAYISTTTDLPGDVTAATATGFATTAGSSQIYVLEAESQRLTANKSWIRLKAVEVVDSPVLAGILIEMLGPRYGNDIPATVIA